MIRNGYESAKLCYVYRHCYGNASDAVTSVFRWTKCKNIPPLTHTFNEMVSEATLVSYLLKNIYHILAKKPDLSIT